MKPSPNQRRSRGRSGSNNSGGGNNSGRRGGRNQNYESNGPEVKVRGSAQQVLDKYLQLARDCQTGGDRVKAEAYLQYAEHYYRIVNEAQENAAAKQTAEQGNDRNKDRGNDRGNDRGDQGAKESGEKSEARPARRPRRNAVAKPDVNDAAPEKNEATLAAEAASANAAKADEAQATVESTAPVAAPSDDATAVGE